MNSIYLDYFLFRITNSTCQTELFTLLKQLGVWHRVKVQVTSRRLFLSSSSCQSSSPTNKATTLANDKTVITWMTLSCPAGPAVMLDASSSFTGLLSFQKIQCVLEYVDLFNIYSNQYSRVKRQFFCFQIFKNWQVKINL